MVYINPNYYGLSSVAFFVLSDFDTDCSGNQLECYISSGPYVLNMFFFDKVNPYLHLAVSESSVPPRTLKNTGVKYGFVLYNLGWWGSCCVHMSGHFNLLFDFI